MMELKSYFDAKFSALEQGFKSGGTKRKRKHKLKYKSSKKQFEFKDIEKKIKHNRADQRWEQKEILKTT